MEKIKAIKIVQQDIKLYLTSFNAEQLRKLFSNKQLIVDVYDPSKTEGKEGYQRGIDEKRVDEIAHFLITKSDILPSLLPSSIVFNCRDSANLMFNENTSELIINENTIFHVIDGQHRVYGLINCKIENYSVPVTIIEGLNIAMEAGQFLVINTKQKRVKPDLQLRILYHQDRSNTRKLINAIGIENWKLEALTISIALNDRNESPWRNLILRPGEKKNNQWKPIPEGHFVETLKFFCSPESPIKQIEIEEKENFLIKYWETIRKLYPDAFNEDSGKRYSLVGGKGSGIFNTLAPLIYYLSGGDEKKCSEILSKLPRKFNIDDYWRKPRGIITKSGSSQGVYRDWAEKIIKAIDKRLNYLDEKNLRKLEKHITTSYYSSILQKARRLLTPLILKSSDFLKYEDIGKRHSCYVFIRFKNDDVSVYVGKSQNAKRRLKSHGKYDLYAVKECRDEREMEDLEMALFHLVKTNIRENDNHPTPADRCPFCKR